MSLIDKEAWNALKRGFLRDVVGRYFDIQFLTEPDIDEKGHWVCEVQRMINHPPMGMVPDDMFKPCTIKLWKSQLGDLKEAFYGEQPPWSIKMVYRVTTVQSTYTKKDGTEGISHKMRVSSTVDIGQRTLPPVPPQGENNQPAAAEAAAGTTSPGSPKPAVCHGPEGDSAQVGSERGQSGTVEVKASEQVAPSPPTNHLEVIQSHPGGGAPCTHPHMDRKYYDDNRYQCTICKQDVVII